MIVSQDMLEEQPMRLRLEILQKCNFFWLRDIRDVDITKCCAKCFIGGKDSRVYNGTRYASSGVVDIEIKKVKSAKAYYLCGLSSGYRWELNTHVAFVPDPQSEVRIKNERFDLTITNARRIHFWDYVPNPPGIFSEEQRGCRNWIFANYLKDGRPL